MVSWGFHYSFPEVFVKSQCDRQDGPSSYYLLYRLVIAVYFLCYSFYVWFSLDYGPRHESLVNINSYSFVLLSQWGIILLTVDTIFQAVIVLNAYYTTAKEESLPFEMPASYKISWCLEVINNSITPLITIIYWSSYNKEIEKDFGKALHVDTLNTVYVLVNQLLTARPVLPQHFIYPSLVGLAYILVNLGYFLSGGRGPYGHTYVYASLDWNKPATCIMMIMTSQLIILLIHSISYASSWIRNRTCKKEVNGYIET